MVRLMVAKIGHRTEDYALRRATVNDVIEGTIVEAVDRQRESHPVWSHSLRVRAAPPRWTRPTAPQR